MENNTSNKDTAKSGNTIPIGSEPQQPRPVASLVEKYSSLDRKIEQARKSNSEQQLEIESIERKITRLVQVDRVAADEAIQNAVKEKEALLETLEKLTVTDLVEAQEEAFLSKSKRDLARLKVEEELRAKQDDYNKFLIASKVFREKIRALSIRGELLGIKTPLALLSVYKFLQGGTPPNIASKDADDRDPNDDIDNLLLIDTNLLPNDRSSNDDGNDPNDEYKNDVEIQALLEELKARNESIKKHHIALEEKKQKYENLLEAKKKKNNQKKDLQSQLDRLQNDICDLKSQIENVNQETIEAIELTSQFRKEVEAESRFEDSDQTKIHSIKGSASAEIPLSEAKNSREKNTSSHQTVPQKKSTMTYNPYARSNRQKKRPMVTAEKINPTRMISPVAGTADASPGIQRAEKKTKVDSIEKLSHSCGDWNDHQSNDPHFQEYRSAATTTPTTNHRKPSKCSKRVRSSRHFGESSFRAPSESLLRIAASRSKGHQDQNKRTKDKSNCKNDARNMRKFSPVLQDLDDTDEDETDDEISWLNANPFLPSSNSKKSK